MASAEPNGLDAGSTRHAPGEMGLRVYTVTVGLLFASRGPLKISTHPVTLSGTKASASPLTQGSAVQPKAVGAIWVDRYAFPAGPASGPQSAQTAAMFWPP